MIMLFNRPSVNITNLVNTSLYDIGYTPPAGGNGAVYNLLFTQFLVEGASTIYYHDLWIKC